MSDKQLQFERHRILQCASRLSPELYAAWSKRRHISRNLAFSHSHYVAWELFVGEPQVVGHFTVVGAYANLVKGVSLQLRVSHRGNETTLWVGHELVDLFGGGRVFANIPHAPTLQFDIAEDGRSRLGIPLVLHMQGSPVNPAEGEMQAEPIGFFRKNYPQFKELRL